jgi:hypothetical protein
MDSDPVFRYCDSRNVTSTGLCTKCRNALALREVQTSFNAEQTEMIAKAFDDAWDVVVFDAANRERGQDEKSINMRTALTTIVTLLLFASTATAQPLPLQKQGPCPSGYRESGGYCSPTSSRAPVAIPKERGQCPSGFMQSGNYCIEMKHR